ncbi:MAG: hypothetical protein AAGD11_07585 [Planctomycetota bacterium]
MSLEQILAQNNSNIFLREFTFSNTKFKRVDGQEVELCDGAVWIDDLLILFQLKERNPKHDTSDSAEETRWFERKVEKNAVGQFADTLTYLETEKQLPFVNHRGQRLNFADAKATRIHLIALFDHPSGLPIDLMSRKGRVSKRAGFVHYFQLGNYETVCMYLHTPFEIAEYLDFRSDFVQRVPASHDVSEKAMFGKFLTDKDDDDEILHEHELVADRLIDDRDEFNISRLMEVYYDRIESGNTGTQYHQILKEMAKLTRNMCSQFRQRFEWAKERCRESKQAKPSRFLPVKQDCGFVSIPIPDHMQDDWQAQLKVYTILCKYDFKCSKCIGYTMAVNLNNPDSYNVNWMYLEFEWQREEELDSTLAEGSWFRDTRSELKGKYSLE